VTQPPGNRQPPSSASWLYAEQFVAESEHATEARVEAGPIGVDPLGRGTAAALTVLARAINAKHVVEIGTGSGVSGLALFAGMAGDGILTSVDIEPENQAVARRAFLATDVPPQRFRLIAGSALNVLPKLSDGAYDLVFVDGDKIEYPAYLEQAIRLLRHGGVLAVDNTLWHDKVADTAANDTDTQAIRQLLTEVRENTDLVDTLLPVGDGLLVAVKR
jgi:predicted O-methyltransferase YrrM